MGRVQPVRRIIRRDTRRMGMSSAVVVVVMPVVPFANGIFGARRCADLRIL